MAASRIATGRIMGGAIVAPRVVCSPLPFPHLFQHPFATSQDMQDITLLQGVHHPKDPKAEHAGQNNPPDKSQPVQRQRLCQKEALFRQVMVDGETLDGWLVCFKCGLKKWTP